MCLDAMKTSLSGLYRDQQRVENRIDLLLNDIELKQRQIDRAVREKRVKLDGDTFDIPRGSLRLSSAQKGEDQ